MTWSYIGANTAVSGTSTLTFAGEPAGAQQNDVLVTAIAYRGANAFSLPSGWTRNGSSAAGDLVVATGADGGLAGLTFFHHFRGASAPNLVFTRTNQSQAIAIGRMFCFRSSRIGVPESRGTNQTQQAAGAGNTGLSVGPGFDTGAIDHLLVFMAAGGTNNTWSNWGTNNNPPTLAEIQDTNTTTGADVSLGVAWGVRANDGPTGDFLVTANVAARHAGLVVHFREPPVAVHTAAAFLHGTSSLTTVARSKRKVTAALSGTSSLTAAAALVAGGVVHPVSASLSGVSSLTAAASRSRRTAAILAGISTLTAAAGRARRTSALLSGTSAIAANVVRARGISATLSGASSLTAAASLVGPAPEVHPVSASLHGTSSLTAAAALVGPGAEVHPVSASLHGTSTLTAVATRKVRVAAVLSGTSTLTAVAALSGPGPDIHPVSALLRGTSGMVIVARQKKAARALLAGTSRLTCRAAIPGEVIVATSKRMGFIANTARMMGS